MAANASTSKPNGQTFDLSKLNLGQLTQFKNQLDQDLTFYQESIQNLKLAQTKFQDSGDSLSKLTPANKDKEILVPLTGSMYVPGMLDNSETVMVDVGTGYYIEKDIAGAKEYFKQKVKYVTENMEKVQAIGNEKNKIREVVMDCMEAKLQVQFAQQQKMQAAQASTSK